MNRNKYSQLHQSLLFHWTQPPDEKGSQTNIADECKFIPKAAPKSKLDREKYIEHLRSILTSGLRFSTPECNNVEEISHSIKTTHRIISLSEWNVGASSEHARRYGHIGLGYTRKYIMSHGGRPVIYLRKSEKSKDPATEAMVKLLQSALKDHDLRDYAQVISSLLKLSKDPRSAKGSADGDDKTNRKKQAKAPDEDHIYALEFGGIHGNLEDREWRILDPNSHDDKPRTLLCEPGKLAMIVVPDHKTLSLALQDDGIRGMVLPEGKPAICMISREMLRSI